MAISLAAAWLAADIAGKTYHALPLSLLWNDIMELSLFVFAAYVISALKGKLAGEEEAAIMAYTMPSVRGGYRLLSAAHDGY